MKPHEFIQTLNAKNPKVVVDRLPDWLVNQWKKSGQDIEDLLTSVNQSDWAVLLLDHLKPRLHKDLQLFLESELIAVGSVEDPAPDAYMQDLDGEGYAIIFHSGLRDFVYRVARIIATRFKPEMFVQGFEPVGTIGETSRLVSEVFWWYQDTGSAFGPSYPIGEFQLRIANLLAVETETFLLAHEIGHILDIGHESCDAMIIKLEDVVSPDHRDEFVADLIGLRLVMGLNSPDADLDPFNTSMIYAGAEFALQIYSGLECLGFEFKDSHPAALARLERMRSEIKASCDNIASWNIVTSMSRGIDSIMRKVIEIIQDPGEYEDFFEREADRVVSELNRLLEQYTGGMVPNYLEFCIAANDLFKQGYSHKMLEHVAQVTAAFVHDLRLVNGESTMNSSTGVRFQKYKLLLMYVSNMREPAQSLFMDALHSE